MKGIYQRVKGKTIRDFIVYSKRKLYLSRVKTISNKEGESFFFTNAYLSKHIKGGVNKETITKLQQSSLGLFGDIVELKKRLLQFAKTNKVLIDELISFANITLDHKVDLLGSGLIKVNFPIEPIGIMGIKYKWQKYSIPKSSFLMSKNYTPIDWHIDFKSGYRWDPAKYYPDSRSYINSLGADIKVPWELSRCQNLPMLGLAYLVTGKEVYAEEIYCQIIDWVDNNPLCKGPNWNCPMDVGIRVSNWLVALELIRTYEHNYNEKRLELVMASLIQHMDYLWNNFEWTSKLTSNHYLSDLAGFLFCVVYIPNIKKKSKYSKFLTNEFKAEIKKQFYADGMNSEGSLPYHRLVMELFTYSHILAEKNGLSFGGKFVAQMCRSFDFTSSILKQDGTIPQIGDNDSGYFLKFFPRQLMELSYLNVLKSAVIDNKEKRLCKYDTLESAIFGASNIIKTETALFKTFKESGISVLKTKDIYFSFYHGLNGQKGNGGHCHNDRLSFTLSYKGQDIFVDPGTGYYTPFPDIRNQFRATSSHNTVQIDNSEQNRFHDIQNLFSIKEDITSTAVNAEKKNNKYYLKASHNGYNRGGINTIHTRDCVISIISNELMVKDLLIGGNTSGVANFIVNSRSTPIVRDQQIYFSRGIMTVDTKTVIVVEPICNSPRYGCIEEGFTYKISIAFNSNLTTLISWKL